MTPPLPHVDPDAEARDDGEPCDECGVIGGYGFVNFGCVTDDCPGCDRCDFPCLTCNREGLIR